MLPSLPIGSIPRGRDRDHWGNILDDHDHWADHWGKFLDGSDHWADHWGENLP